MILTNQKNPQSKVFIYLSLLLLCQLITNNAYAANHTLPNENKLLVTPKRCVALRKGQTCYQQVTFKWHQVELGDYCLVELSTLHKLKCWTKINNGEFSFDFQSDKTRHYALRKSKQDSNLATAIITVSWVFESSKRPKSSWKLF
ncbi:DUF3019 domain-containing protein [Pseudoalteromonas sp. NEC-BIFX-2020_002]|uniref:DUF3019 domain-containing protein n=1 Tax=Pseudoalteromonas neustonica TaxID=1840331 RepID=A0ABU9U091_9GAMM|nr:MULTISPECIES: DUF3019 domain-containing protein [Pseudoalteromonas]NNG41966.1 DUF3019 domain-containing protein [Pseudoalteromonas sp. NEC-BIFX-2020_002]